MESYLLGIDVGTTGAKTMLFSQNGEVLGHSYQSYQTDAPQVAYREQNAEDWWQAVVKTVRGACRNLETASQVAAISLSLQGGTLVAVDAQFRPLRPAIVWNDGRCAEEREAFLKDVGEASIMYQKTGWGLDYGLPALELRWLKEHEPELMGTAAWFLTVPDYISAKMTGRPVVDLSDAGINQLTDIRRGAYDEALLRFAGVTEGRLGTLAHSGDVIGHLTAEAAGELGLTTDTVLVAGAHDQYAVALGAGATQDGDILIGSGTSWVVTAISSEPAFYSGLSQSVAAVPRKWGSLYSLSSGGVCLDWWRRLTAGISGEQFPYDTLSKEAARRRAAEDGLFFFPFTGRSAGGRSFQKASFTGLDLSHDQFTMARAIMEGVAFQVVWMMEQFREKPSGAGVKLAGGASRSGLWCQMVADIANLPVRIPEVADLACVGAAILAGTGSGIFPDVEEGYRRLAVGERVLLPDPARSARYQEWFMEYKRTAEALGAVYRF